MQITLIAWLGQHGLKFSQFTSLLIVLGLIYFTAIIIHFILHRIVLSNLKKRGQSSKRLWLKVITQTKLFHRLAFTFQGIIINIQVGLWLQPGTNISNILIVCTQLWIITYALLSLFSLLDTLLDLARTLSIAAQLPLRGIFQSIKLVATLFVSILIISLLIGKSPLLLISGLGAMAAVLMLIFKDPILGLVAGIQLSANNMLNLNDWLEMPKYGADGSVIDIGLTTVKVRNWDNTITTIPTYSLVSDSFKNWRGMSESGGRRIKRSINIDTTSVHFLSEAEHEYLLQSHLLKPYITAKTQELDNDNNQHQVDLSSPLNGRRMTNLGTFRAYLQYYLRSHPRIHQDMTLMVRQLAPTSEGLPLEIYAFTHTTVWAEYENIQADIFDHSLAIISDFNLRLHQNPTGNDIRFLGEPLSQKINHG